MVRTLKITLTVLPIMLVLLFLAAFIVVSLFDSPEYARRLLLYGQSDTDDYLIFPERDIQNGANISTLETANADLLQTVTWRDEDTGTERVENLGELLLNTDTKAFIVIQDDAVVYEGYFNGATRDAIQTSFSIAKSFNTALIGAALTEGKIGSVDDPVVKYVPEIAGRGLDTLTIRDLLLMNSGIRYEYNRDRPFYLLPFGDDSLTYYAPDLRRTALRVEAGDTPLGAAYHYNNYHPLLEGLILERVTSMSVAEYLQERIWKPMGAEYPASWSLDSEASGFEKMESGINARPIDFARFGLVFLHAGFWNGVQILPAGWVREATAPLTADPRDYGEWADRARDGWYYKYHWYGQQYSGSTYDYYAHGNHGQYIYVAPRKNAVLVRLGAAPESYPVTWRLIIKDLVDQLPLDGQ